MKESFLNLFDEVFDNNGNIKNCGREKCLELIKIADSLESEISHGNLKTGFLNINLIKNLKQKLS